jgi:Zn-dependent alcohol dehydrogenase
MPDTADHHHAATHAPTVVVADDRGNPFIRDVRGGLLRLYRAGQLKLDELITRRYRLDEINQGYQDLDDGKIIRGVILHAA